MKEGRKGGEVAKVIAIGAKCCDKVVVGGLFLCYFLYKKLISDVIIAGQERFTRLCQQLSVKNLTRDQDEERPLALSFRISRSLFGQSGQYARLITPIKALPLLTAFISLY